MAYLNGEYIDEKNAFISVMDRGFLFGDGVYEVIPVYQAKIFKLDEHIKRLTSNLELIRIKNPYNLEKWQEILNKLISELKSDNQSIYIQISRGVDVVRKHLTTKELKPTIFIKTTEFKPHSYQYLKKGHKAITRDDIRWQRCNIKSTSLLANVLYAYDAGDKNVEEVILIKDGVVTEGSSSNIFIYADNTIYTHPIDKYILPGVTRNLVIKVANKLNINVKEAYFSKETLLMADEVFISSSTREIMPIISIDNKKIADGKIGDIWQKLYKSYQEIK